MDISNKSIEIKNKSFQNLGYLNYLVVNNEFASPLKI